MKTIYTKIIKRYLWIVAFGFLIATTSCIDYLDKAPEVDITEGEVFGTFPKFQGFIENIYESTVDVTLATSAEMGWNFGGDEVLYGSSPQFMAPHFEKGDYWKAVTQARYNPFLGFFGPGSNVISGTYDNRGRGYWRNGWYGIRQANIAISNMDKLVNATQEEKNVILGQALFFRAYYHFEILRAWGHIAYVDTVYAPSDVIKPATGSFKSVSDRIDQDLRQAASLLPEDWDNTTVGQATLNNNRIRVTKGTAYAYIGLNALWAGSPLPNGEETGNFIYNTELCIKAAEAYNEVIKLADKGVYHLETWDNYFKNFYTLKAEMPLGKEIIWASPIITNKRWNHADQVFRQLGGWGHYASPTANYVEYFGMANGLPLDEPDSGYDEDHPWENRDPRFYYNIVKDGDLIIHNPNQVNHADRIVQFYVGGRHRLPQSANSLSGYGYKKFKDMRCNSVDNAWSGNYYYECPKMRLAGVYLEYAEAVNEVYGPTGSIPGGMTALEAVNRVRARAGVPEVDTRFHTKETLREIIRQERAVELAFEGHRWYDLRRWYVANQTKYREKYVLDFDKDHTYFLKRLYLTTVFEPKHWWLPFEVNQVSLYPEFKQNPGW